MKKSGTSRWLTLVGTAAISVALAACGSHHGSASSAASQAAAAQSSFSTAHPSAAAVENAAAQALQNPTIKATVVKAKTCAGLPADLHNLTYHQAKTAYGNLNSKADRDKVYQCAGIGDPQVRHTVGNCLGGHLFPDKAWTVSGMVKIIDIELPVCLQQAGVGGATPSPTTPGQGAHSPPASPATAKSASSTGA